MITMLATASSANAQNLLSNPGFETPALSDGEWVEAFPDPWFRMDPYGNYRHGNPLASELTPYDGVQVMETSNNCPLDQTIAVPGGLLADTVYTFTVHCMRPSWETGDSTMTIAIGYGGWSEYFRTDITHNSEDWGEYSISFDTAVDGGVGETELNVEAWTRTGGTLVYDGMFAYTGTVIPSDEKIEITETGGSTDVVEGGATDTYDITLTGRYDGEDVSMQVSPGPQLNVGNGVNTPLDLNFTRVSPSDPNWIAHTVTVTANNDTAPEGDHTGVITHLTSSNDPNFHDLSAEITVNITDDDGSAVLSKTTASVSEDGAQDQYTIHLEGSPPPTDVVVAITTTDQAGTDKH